VAEESDRPTLDADRLFETTRRDGVVEFARPGTRWLSTGWRGGASVAPAAYSLTVPEGWHVEDVGTYVDERLADAGFDAPGVDAAETIRPTRAAGRRPVLLTGVAARHCRGARCGPVEAYATAGLSNPAALPADPDGDPDPDGSGLPDGEYRAGTVNVVVGTERGLAPGALANLVSVATEARTATLLDRVGVPGTTSDAVVAACDPGGERATFSGSATRVGAAARACVREAVTAALAAGDGDDPGGASGAVDDARYGVSTTTRAAVFEP